MSPGSLIATSQLLCVTSDTFCATSQRALDITRCELHSTPSYFRDGWDLASLVWKGRDVRTERNQMLKVSRGSGSTGQWRQKEDDK